MEIKRRNGYYYFNNRHNPAVSTILKSAGNSAGLINWAAKQGAFGAFINKPTTVDQAGEFGIAHLKMESERVAKIGTNSHQGIENYYAHDPIYDSLTELESTIVKTYIDFSETIGIEMENCEMILNSTKYGFGGQLDMVTTLTDEQITTLKTYLARSSEVPELGRVIVDYKTGSLYIKSHEVQMAAYYKAYEEMTGNDCVGALLVNIKRDTPDKLVCHYITKKTLTEAFEKGFLPAYQTWEYFDAPKWFKEQACTKT